MAVSSLSVDVFTKILWRESQPSRGGGESRENTAFGG